MYRCVLTDCVQSRTDRALKQSPSVVVNLGLFVLMLFCTPLSKILPFFSFIGEPGELCSFGGGGWGRFQQLSSVGGQ